LAPVQFNQVSGERQSLSPDFAIPDHWPTCIRSLGRWMEEKLPQCLALMIAKPVSSISIRNTTQASSSHHWHAEVHQSARQVDSGSDRSSRSGPHSERTDSSLFNSIAIAG
jgi:hypothetical protein